VRAVAETGVDSNSLAWLTHSARSLDLGLDVA
jgi:nicotinate-nucleotide pyrophosphorylase